MRRPIIGITAEALNRDARSERPFKYGQSYTYSEAVFRAGGVPVVLPITHDVQETSEMIKAVDGILFSGGSDIHPLLYGQQTKGAHGSDLYRDEHEMRLMDYAYGSRLPILAICRGMQLLNVHNCGTLYQDIRSEVPGAMNHDGYAREPDTDRLIHEIRIDPKSKLAKILGMTAISANTYHHQAIDDIGESLVASAWAEDGIIEAIEEVNEEFVIGIQAHPEALEASIEPRWRLLFQSFVNAANTR